MSNKQRSYRVPVEHDDVCGEGVVNVLARVEVDEITVVVEHVHTCSS